MGTAERKETPSRVRAVGDRIAERRATLGLSQMELAGLLGHGSTTKRSVQHWESGKWNLSGGTLLKLANRLRTTPAYLLGETDDPSPIWTVEPQEPVPSEGNGAPRFLSGSVVRTLRLHAGLYRRQVGEAAGVVPSAVGWWERSERQHVGEARVEKLAELFQVTPRQLAGLDPLPEGMEQLPAAVEREPVSKPDRSDQPDQIDPKSLRALRYRRGYTREAFSEAASVSGSSVSNWETGRFLKVGAEKLARLAEILHATRTQGRGSANDRRASVPAGGAS